MALSETDLSARRSCKSFRSVSFRGAFRYGHKEQAAKALNSEITPIALGESASVFFPPIAEDNIATKQDVKNRITEQNERCLKYLQNGGWDPANLSVSWRKYLIRHWDELKERL